MNKSDAIRDIAEALVCLSKAEPEQALIILRSVVAALEEVKASNMWVDDGWVS